MSEVANTTTASALPSHDTILYLDKITVSFDGFKALNEL
jgi:ABC-type uncharacterized transport system ATPase subunit